MTPGTKVAVISKSAASITHVAPSEEKAGKEAPKPSPPAEKEAEKPKVAPSIKEKPEAPSPAPPKAAASEPRLPPKERERRVNVIVLCFIINYLYCKMQILGHLLIHGCPTYPLIEDFFVIF